MALNDRRLAFIGAGHITNIILDNLVKAEKFHTHRVIASDPEKNNNTPVVRALPNPPSQIGMGIAALAFNPHVTDKQKSDIFELFASLGEYVVLREENMIWQFWMLHIFGISYLNSCNFTGTMMIPQLL